MWELLSELVLPQIRVEVLTTLLAREIEKPHSLNIVVSRHLMFHRFLKNDYIFSLVGVGPEAIPHLRRYLEHLNSLIENGSVKTPQNLNRLPKVEKRQLILCTLGLLSDKTVYRQVMEIFLEAADDLLRAFAARALGEMKNKAAIPALKRALKDGCQVTYPTDVRF